MLKAIAIIGAGLALTACSPRVPESGVGFTEYTEFERARSEREAALRGSGSTAFPGPANVQTQAISSTELSAVGIGAAAPVTQPPLSALAPAPAAAPRPAANNPGISDEQDFSAVASRETIESDAQRRARQAAARQEVQPTALPQRPADTGPNIVAYALSAPNVKGQEWYSRFMFSGQGRFQRNCASYNSPDAAQRDFLARGGPERDPRGIDPDGDGFACGWDPAPFLLAADR